MLLFGRRTPVQECDIAGEAVEVLQEPPYPGVAPRVAVLRRCRKSNLHSAADSAGARCGMQQASKAQSICRATAGSASLSSGCEVAKAMPHHATLYMTPARAHLWQHKANHLLSQRGVCTESIRDCGLLRRLFHCHRGLCILQHLLVQLVPSKPEGPCDGADLACALHVLS
jgi:hypothetical protein